MSTGGNAGSVGLALPGSLQVAHAFIANQLQLQSVQHALEHEGAKLRDAESRLVLCEQAREELLARARNESELTQRRIADAERRSDDLQGQCRQISQRAADSSREREHIRRQLQQWDSATKEVMSRFGEMNAHAAEREASHTAEIGAMRARAGAHATVLVGALRDVEEAVAAAAEVNGSLCADGRNHVTEIEGLRKAMAMAERTIESVEARADELKERAFHLCAELEKAQAACASAQAEGEELRKGTAERELNLRSEASRRELAEKNTQELISAHDAHVATERELVGRLKAELESAQRLLTEQQAAHAHKAQQLEASCKAATEQQAELERKTEKLRADLDGARRELARGAEQGVRSLAELRASLEASASEALARDARAHDKALEEARSRAASELHAARAEVATTAAEVSTLKAHAARVPELERKAERAEKDGKEHQIGFRLEQQRVADLEARLAAAQEEKSALVSERAALDAKAEAATQALAQRDADAQASQAQGSKAAAAAAKKLAAAEAAAAAGDKEAKAAQKKQRELQAAHKKLEEQLHAHESRAQEADGKARAIEEQHAQLQAELAKARREQEALAEAADAQQAERERLGHSLAQSELLAAERGRLLARAERELAEANQSIFALEADMANKKDEVARLRAAQIAGLSSPVAPEHELGTSPLARASLPPPSSASPLVPSALNFDTLATTPLSEAKAGADAAQQGAAASQAAPSPWTALLYGKDAPAGADARRGAAEPAPAPAEPKSSDQPTQRGSRGAPRALAAQAGAGKKGAGQRGATGKGRKPKGANAAAAASADDVPAGGGGAVRAAPSGEPAQAEHFDIFDFAGL